MLIADDSEFVLSSLVAIVSSHPGLECVATAGSADAAIEAAVRHQPDVALLDVRMPGGGENAARGIAHSCPRTRVIAVSGMDDEATAQGMRQAGAVGYVIKGSPVSVILETIVRAAPPAAG